MKLFSCENCGSIVHFESTSCVSCGFRLGYLPALFAISAVQANGTAWKPFADPTRDYIFCDNAAEHACNWLVPAGTGETMCVACRHNHVVPDLTIEDNRVQWRKLETAKHYLFYSLTRWNLPIPNRADDPDHGLIFDFRSDAAEPDAKVLTGHDEGLITINLAEADNAVREQRRTAMHEPYRTLIGHFRHEIGHYYWDLLVRDAPVLERVRAVFGDDHADYAEALKRHYQSGAPAGWQDSFISAYATTHPWEDFAETWAHYNHMVDALETARSFGLSIHPRHGLATHLSASVSFDPYAAESAERLVSVWAPVTIAVNSINRSLGQPDLYPFILSTPVMEKLQLVHEIIHARLSAGTEAPVRQRASVPA